MTVVAKFEYAHVFTSRVQEIRGMSGIFALFLFIGCGILHLFPIVSKPFQSKFLIISVLMIVVTIYLGLVFIEIPKNYYQILEVTRDCTIANLRHGYRQINLKYHPDKVKQNGGLGKSDIYSVQSAFETLQDEKKRDCYNRFGPDKCSIDPRENEVQLIIEMIAYYLSWFIGLVIVTIPKSSHSSRFWSSLYVIIVIIIQTIFTFTEIEITILPIQTIFPALTEYEIIQYFRLCIPVIFLLFRIIVEWSYIDVEKETIKYLMTISQNHKLMIESLQQISQQITQYKKINEQNSLTYTSFSPPSSSSSSSIPLNINLDLNKLIEQMTNLEKESTIISNQIHLTHSLSQKNYYWIIFILMFLFFQLLGSNSS